MPINKQEYAGNRDPQTHKYDNDTLQKIMERMRFVRERNGLSLKKVAENGKKLFDGNFVSEAALGHYETLKRVPDMVTFLKMVAAYGVENVDVSRFFPDYDFWMRYDKYRNELESRKKNVSKTPELDMAMSEIMTELHESTDKLKSAFGMMNDSTDKLILNKLGEIDTSDKLKAYIISNTTPQERMDLILELLHEFRNDMNEDNDT